MPVFRSGEGNAPSWGLLDDFEFIELRDDEPLTMRRAAAKEQYVVCRGAASVDFADVETYLGENSRVDLAGPAPDSVTIRARYGDALVFHALGRWESVTSAGLFFPEVGPPREQQTPHEYEKSVSFDNHYHDCDEYWMIFQGRCHVCSEGKFYALGPGDCLATGMGWHHDIVSIEGDEPVKGVYFESALEGRRRFGHLWEPVHGKAEPCVERV